MPPPAAPDTPDPDVDVDLDGTEPKERDGAWRGVKLRFPCKCSDVASIFFILRYRVIYNMYVSVFDHADR